MRRRTRVIRTALLAALVLAVAAACADASTFTVVGDTFRDLWNAVTFEAAGTTVRCPLTMEGSFSQSTFSKVTGSRIGSVTRGVVGACTGGTASILPETLPWTTQYSSFAGALPTITGITMRLVGAGFSITPSGFPTCTARTTEAEPLPFIASRESHGAITSVRLEETSAIRLTGGFLCEAARGHIAGTGTSTVAGSATKVMLLLGVLGTALAGATPEEQETENPIKKVIIPAGAREGSRGIRNISPYEITLTSVVLIGSNSEKFLLAEEETACRRLPTLRPNESCNVRIAIREERNARPYESSVQITYRWGGGTQTSSQSFVVRAES